MLFHVLDAVRLVRHARGSLVAHDMWGDQYHELGLGVDEVIMTSSAKGTRIADLGDLIAEVASEAL